MLISYRCCDYKGSDSWYTFLHIYLDFSNNFLKTPRVFPSQKGILFRKLSSLRKFGLEKNSLFGSYCYTWAWVLSLLHVLGLCLHIIPLPTATKMIINRTSVNENESTDDQCKRRYVNRNDHRSSQRLVYYI